jgi:hypothetical protein
MPVKITVTGDEKIQSVFTDINDFDKWATPPITKATERLYKRVKTYPPDRGGKYKRTFTLQRSIDWNVTSAPTGVIGHVYSSGANQGRGDYESFVKVDGAQAEIHVGYWDTDKDDLDNEEPYIMEEISKAAAELLR